MPDLGIQLDPIYKRIVVAVFKAKQAALPNGRFTLGDAIEVARKVYESEPQPKPRAPRREKPYTAMTEPEFLAFLEAEPALRGVDIKQEIGKCQFWCKSKGYSPPSRARIMRWLLKADKTLSLDCAGASSRERKQDGIPEPLGWREYVRENLHDSSYADGPWAALDKIQQAHIAAMVANGRAA